MQPERGRDSANDAEEQSGADAATDEATGHRLTTLLGKTLSRDATYYTIGMASVFPLGLANALWVTGYLEPSEYGFLGLLMLLAGLVTMVYGLGIIQGTLMWAYGAAGEDGDDDGGGEDVTDTARSPQEVAATRHRILGSGMVLSICIALVGTTLLLAFSDPIARFLGPSDTLRVGVMWAAVSAGLGSLWRLSLQFFRMERRAVMYLVVSVSRPLFVLVLTIWLLSRGGGLEAAIAATALGTALSLGISVTAALGNYDLGFRPADFAQIFRNGRGLIPIIVALWFVGNLDLWLLSRFSPAAEVGLYRLASRFGIFPSYVTSAYLMAWVPIERSAIFKATTRSRPPGTVTSTVFTYFCIGSASLLLLLTIVSEILISIAPSSYRDAAPFVPAVAAVVVGQGIAYALYRLGRFPHRRLWYVLSSLMSALVLAGLSPLLAPPFGGYGVAAAGMAGAVTGALILLSAIRRRSNPVRFEWRRIFGAFAIALACLAFVVVPPGGLLVRSALDLLACLAYPLLLLATGIIPRAHARDLVEVIRAMLPRRPGQRQLSQRLAELPPSQRDAIEQQLRAGSARARRRQGPPDQEQLALLTRGLRTLVDHEGVRESEQDAEIGAYLLQRGSHVDRDFVAERLVEGGVDPLELHLLDDAYQTLRQRRRPRRTRQELAVSAARVDRP